MGFLRYRPPSTPPLPPPPPREVHLSVWGQGKLIAFEVLGSARLVPEPTGRAIPATFFAAENRLRFVLPTDTPYGWGAQLHLDAPDYQPFDQRVFLAPDLDVEMLPLTPLAEGLIIDGAFFRTAVTRQPFTVIGCSDFNLLARYLADENILPVLEQRQSIGFNWLRVWTAFAVPGIGRLVPAEQPTLYARLPAFVDLVARHGCCVELTAFAGPELLGSATAQVQHWLSLQGAIRGMPQALLERCNENDQTNNRGLATTLLTRPVGILASAGSNGSQATPVRPWWDYETFHTNDAPEWWRKSHNAMECSEGADGLLASREPVVLDEKTRFPDKTSSLAHIEDDAAGAALLCAGSTFHSVRGKTSQLWDGLELNGAIAHVAGARRPPLEFQRGRYVHRTDLEPAGILRAYSRRLSDGREHVETIRV